MKGNLQGEILFLDPCALKDYLLATSTTLDDFGSSLNLSSGTLIRIRCNCQPTNQAQIRLIYDGLISDGCCSDRLAKIVWIYKEKSLFND